MIKSSFIVPALMLWSLTACNRGEKPADAFGNFQADEIMVSAETSGRINKVFFSEGMQVAPGGLALRLDTVQYSLKVKELQSKLAATTRPKTTVYAQVAVHDQQRAMLQHDLQRIQKMFADGAATQKQVDDLAGQVEVTERQIGSVRSNLQGIAAEAEALESALLQAKDMLARTSVHYPVGGVVLEKYMEQGEMATPGKALFKLADISVLRLKAYLAATQLPDVKLGQKVDVAIDSADGRLIHFDGVVSWISPKAEFTPKIIQTKDERVNLVYAIKVDVANNGQIKIGMPGELRFTPNVKQ